MKKSQFLKVVNDYIAKEEASIAEHEEICEILKPHIGKLINGRTLNEKNLRGYVLDQRYGMFYLKGKLQNHLIGYASHPYIHLESTESSKGFFELDACAGRAARERVEKIRNTDLDKAFKIYNDIDKTFNKLRGLFRELDEEKLTSFHFAPFYDVLNAIYPKKGNLDLLIEIYYTRK